MEEVACTLELVQKECRSISYRLNINNARRREIKRKRIQTLTSPYNSHNTTTIANTSPTYLACYLYHCLRYILVPFIYQHLRQSWQIFTLHIQI